MTRICVLTRVKNERYLDEFVDFYINEGVDQIYLLNDNSDYVKSLQRVAKNPQVTVLNACDHVSGWKHSLQYCSWNLPCAVIRNLHNVSNREALQFLLRVDYLRKFYAAHIRKNYDWVVNVDADEYMIGCHSFTLRYLLENIYQDVDCVVCHWLNFGHTSSDYPRSLLKTNVYRENPDIKNAYLQQSRSNTKSIFRTDAFALWANHVPLMNTRRVLIALTLLNRVVEVPHDPHISFVNSWLFQHNVQESPHVWKNEFTERSIRTAPLMCAHFQITCLRDILDKVQRANQGRYIEKYRDYLQNVDLLKTDHVKDLRIFRRLQMHQQFA